MQGLEYAPEWVAFTHRKGKMGKSAVLLVGVLCVFIILGTMMMQSLVIIQRIASVSEAAGDVYVRSPGDQDFHALGESVRVAAGYTVRTGENGTVTLNWVDGSRVRLAPNTTVQVRKCSLNTSTKQLTSLFDLDAGRIFARVVSAPERAVKFEVHTPSATAIVHGTVFSVSVEDGGSTDVAVYEGEVVLSARAGSATLSPGQQASARQDAAPVASPDDSRDAWREQQGIIGPRLDLDAGETIALSPGAGSVTLSGTSEPGAVVTINGTPVQLDRRNRFVAEVSAGAAADGMIVIAAADNRGGQTVRAISILAE